MANNIHLAFLFARGSLLALWCWYSAFYSECCAIGAGYCNRIVRLKALSTVAMRCRELIANEPPKLAASQRTLRAWQVCGQEKSWLVFIVLQNLGAEVVDRSCAYLACSTGSLAAETGITWLLRCRSWRRLVAWRVHLGWIHHESTCGSHIQLRIYCTAAGGETGRAAVRMGAARSRMAGGTL